MRKTLAVIMVMFILVSLSPLCVFGLAHDPYVGLNGADYDSADKEYVRNTDGSLGGAASYGSYIVFKGVDFGDMRPFKIDIVCRSPLDNPSYMGGAVEVRLDSKGGQVIAKATTVSTVFQKYTSDVTMEITGVHDIYVVFPTKPTYFRSVNFERYSEDGSEYEVYESPDYLEDIRNNPKKSEIYTLIELGLIKPFVENEFNEMSFTTRLDFAKIMADILNINSDMWEKSSFSDVPEDSNGLLAGLEGMGIISKNPDGVFRSYEYITGVEAVAMALRALGYEDVAKAKGGYPQGYLNTATAIGLLDGVNIQNELRHRDSAKLIYNMIDAEYLETTSVSGNITDYTRVTTGILGKTKDIYRGIGTIDATSETSLVWPLSPVPAGCVSIDGEVYKTGDTPAFSLLGYKVVYYYKDALDGTQRELLSVAPQRNIEVITVDTSLEDDVTKLSEEEFSYFSNDEVREQTVKIPLGTHIIYNGMAIDDALVNLLQPGAFRGTIHYIDNGDSTALVVDQYVDTLAQTVNSREKAIYDGLTKAWFNFGGDNDNVLIFYNGRSIPFSGISDGNVVSVYESKNKSGEKLYRLVVSFETVTGTITQTNDDYVYVNDIAYKLSSEASQKFPVGLQAQFSISAMGEVVGYKPSSGTSSSDKVGILIDFSTESGLQPNVFLKVFEKSNQAAVFECSDNIIIDGTTIKKPQEIISGNGKFPGLNLMDVKGTLVRYRTDSSGKISMMDTYVKVADNQNDTFTKINSTSVTMRYNGTSKVFTDVAGKAYSPYSKVPELFGSWSSDEESFLYASALTHFASDSLVIDITGDMYTLDSEKPYVNYVFWKNVSSRIQWEDPFVFSEKILSLDGDETVYKIRGYKDSASVEYILSKSDFDNPSNDLLRTTKSIFENAKPGDVIRVAKNGKGRIYRSEIIFLASGEATNPDGIEATIHAEKGLGGSGGVSHPYYLLYGTVVDRLDDFFKVEYKEGGRVYTDWFKAGTMSIRCDLEGKKPVIQNQLPYDEIMIGDKIVTCAVYTTKVLCAYNNPALE